MIYYILKRQLLGLYFPAKYVVILQLSQKRLAVSKSDNKKKSLISQKSVGLGWRLGLEFVSGVIVGLGLGYGFDRLFNTNPWGILVFILLGAAAGFLNVYRLAKDGFVKPHDDNDNEPTGHKTSRKE